MAVCKAACEGSSPSRASTFVRFAHSVENARLWVVIRRRLRRHSKDRVLIDSRRMDPFFTWIEMSALSIWLRESPSLWAFPFVLILHTVGLAFLVGAANVALDVRVSAWPPACRFAHCSAMAS